VKLEEDKQFNQDTSDFRYYDDHDEDCCQYEKSSNCAWAKITGGPLAPDIRGKVFFEEISCGVVVSVEICGLPPYQPAQGERQPIGPHGFHLHENGNCDIGDPKEPFSGAGGHWNPTNQPHGNHVGDFPVLFSNHGVAKMSFFTDKFRVRDIIGRSLIIHQNPDDYRSQPAGNSGKRLACGIIRWCHC
jgi:Cu-Zn family superoxide dismutase